MFWDGDRWVDDRPLNRQGAPALPRPRRRPRAWLVALPIVVLMSALLIPFWPINAAGPRLSVGGNAVPGAWVTVVGDGFNASTWIQLEWDGSAAGLPTAWTSSQGTFGTLLKIPANATPGPHLLGAGASSWSGRGATPAVTTAALASVTVMVLDPVAAPTPVVTAAPTPLPVMAAPTQTARPDPTSRPLATAAPTQTATPAPTSRPLATAAPRPTPMVSATATSTPVVTPPAVGCVGTLQSKIDAAPAGSTLDLTGCTYGVGATVTKPLTIVGATIKPPRGATGLVVSANDVTLNGLHIIGPQATIFNAGEFGITVVATASAPVRRLTIRNSEVARFGMSGMWLRYVSDLVVEHNNVHDTVYAGIMVLSGSGGSITGNLVERIGVVGSGANGGNAYGIALSQQNPARDPPTTHFTVSRNTVDNVPTWHAFDTHSGQHIVWTGNIARGSRSGFFITGYATARALDNDIKGNTVYGSSGSYWAITSVYSTGGYIRGNNIVRWPSGHEILETSSGDSAATAVNLTVSGNTITP